MSKKTMMGSDGRLYTLMGAGVVLGGSGPDAGASMSIAGNAVVNDMTHSNVCFSPAAR